MAQQHRVCRGGRVAWAIDSRVVAFLARVRGPTAVDDASASIVACVVRRCLRGTRRARLATPLVLSRVRLARRPAAVAALRHVCVHHVTSPESRANSAKPSSSGMRFKILSMSARPFADSIRNTRFNFVTFFDS